MSRSDDYLRYEELLEATKDVEGIRHRDAAVKLLSEELASDDERIIDFAEARAIQVADGFDRAHTPEIDSGQMALMETDYLVIADNERVPVTEATSNHTRQWLNILAHNKAKVDAAYAAKYLHAERLAAIQDELRCSMWEAEMHLREAS